MKTKIAKIGKNSIEIAGVGVGRLMGSCSPASLLLFMAGLPPTDAAVDLVNRLIVGFSDHGLSPPSTICTRLVASCGGDLPKGLIAALACMGDTHAPIVQAMRFLADWDIGLPMPKRIPGYGHPIHTEDPRVGPLLYAALDKLQNVKHCCRARDVELRIRAPLNYAGACAAICLDLGIPPPFAQLIAIMGRMIGLTAHWHEQSMQPQRVICYDEPTGQFLE